MITADHGSIPDPRWARGPFEGVVTVLGDVFGGGGGRRGGSEPGVRDTTGG